MHELFSTCPKGWPAEIFQGRREQKKFGNSCNDGIRVWRVARGVVWDFTCHISGGNLTGSGTAMITSTRIKDMLNRQPFQPFRIFLSDGSHHDVPHPALAWAFV